MPEEQVARLPFHEALVDAIHSASMGVELECLARLIKATKIPNGHDEIIAAWDQRRDVMGWEEADFGVRADLLEQKEEAAKEAAEKAAAKEQAGPVIKR